MSALEESRLALSPVREDEVRALHVALAALACSSRGGERSAPLLPSPSFDPLHHNLITTLRAHSQLIEAYNIAEERCTSSHRPVSVVSSRFGSETTTELQR